MAGHVYVHIEPELHKKIRAMSIMDELDWQSFLNHLLKLGFDAYRSAANPKAAVAVAVPSTDPISLVRKRVR